MHHKHIVLALVLATFCIPFVQVQATKSASDYLVTLHHADSDYCSIWQPHKQTLEHFVAAVELFLHRFILLIRQWIDAFQQKVLDFCDAPAFEWHLLWSNSDVVTVVDEPLLLGLRAKERKQRMQQFYDSDRTTMVAWANYGLVHTKNTLKWCERDWLKALDKIQGILETVYTSSTTDKQDISRKIQQRIQQAQTTCFQRFAAAEKTITRKYFYTRSPTSSIYPYLEELRHETFDLARQRHAKQQYRIAWECKRYMDDVLHMLETNANALQHFLPSESMAMVGQRVVMQARIRKGDLLERWDVFFGKMELEIISLWESAVDQLQDKERSWFDLLCTFWESCKAFLRTVVWFLASFSHFSW
ncbi:hypothetical protein DFQ28_003022 [Apophysomyces sp. BC1034]|nr:hypothetical protein DFQ30_008387 [Apophysomyces sp. BC1015]KAG0179312.1 hypothetical protein DFQ29_002256 [Apophysomyces sp. BC1021]KAG0189742.1 hypothetical protein DFQ28_003022 [Apophysomyces sp. BC1034]